MPAVTRVPPAPAIMRVPAPGVARGGHGICGCDIRHPCGPRIGIGPGCWGSLDHAAAEAGCKNDGNNNARHFSHFSVHAGVRSSPAICWWSGELRRGLREACVSGPRLHNSAERVHDDSLYPIVTRCYDPSVVNLARPSQPDRSRLTWLADISHCLASQNVERPGPPAAPASRFAAPMRYRRSAEMRCRLVMIVMSA